MENLSSKYLSLPAIRVDQPLGSFYVTKISAQDLLKISFSNPLRITDEEGSLLGNQRVIKSNRIKDIAAYIDTVESAFPNSIILAANYDSEGNLIEDESIRWQLVLSEDNETGRISIPTSAAVASIIDGQHRLNAFKHVNNESRLKTELLCAVYFDLPLSYQAYLFATINYNQKKVDKSLAYELFGYNLDDEPQASWSPEKTAVFITRELNINISSTLNNHIVIAPQNDDILFKISAKKMPWYVSTATVVEGILSLISTNPKRDKDLIHRLTIENGRNRRSAGEDKSPLRLLYLSANDLAIYTAVENYFKACQNILFSKASSSSYIQKTVGIQALFDFLKKILDVTFSKEKDISVSFFENYLRKASNVDFADKFFQASGLGRNRIKNTLLIASNLTERAVADIEIIDRLLAE